MKTTRAITVIASALLTLLPMPSARAAATPLAPATGTTTLVSVASDGTQANAASYDPAMSADGQSRSESNSMSSSSSFASHSARFSWWSSRKSAISSAACSLQPPQSRSPPTHSS